MKNSGPKSKREALWLIKSKKPDNANPDGGLIEKECPINASNVKLAESKKATKKKETKKVAKKDTEKKAPKKAATKKGGKE